jgi:hypothetical protein
MYYIIKFKGGCIVDHRMPEFCVILMCFIFLFFMLVLSRKLHFNKKNTNEKRLEFFKRKLRQKRLFFCCWNM